MVNKVILLGNVGKDPEVKYLDSGSCLANFSLATSRKWKDKNNNTHTDTQWHRLVVWGKLGEIVEKYVKKGSQLYIEGEIRYRDYDNKEGKKVYVTEIYVDTLKLLGGHREGEVKVQQQQEEIDSFPPQPTDDLPF